MLHSASLEAMRVISDHTKWDIFKDDVEREKKKELGI